MQYIPIPDDDNRIGQIDEHYREFMWINHEEGWIAFDVKDVNHKHKYYEYLKYFHKQEG